MDHMERRLMAIPTGKFSGECMRTYSWHFGPTNIFAIDLMIGRGNEVACWHLQENKKVVKMMALVQTSNINHVTMSSILMHPGVSFTEGGVLCNDADRKDNINSTSSNFMGVAPIDF